MSRCKFCGAPENKCSCQEGPTDGELACPPPEEETVYPPVPSNPDDGTNQTSIDTNIDLEIVKRRLTVQEQVIRQLRQHNEEIQCSLQSAESALLDCQRKYDELEKEKCQIERSVSEGKSHETVIESELKQQRKIAQKAQEDIKSVRAALDSLQVKYARKVEKMTTLQNEMERVQNDLTHTRAQLNKPVPPVVQANDKAGNLQMVAYGVALGAVISLLIIVVIFYKLK